MELSSTRKLLSVIFSLLTALATAILIASLLAGSTITSRQFLEKYFVNGSLVTQCNEQLSAKYLVLEAETGIPHTVFETVNNEYPIQQSLTTAFQNSFGSENAELYNRNLVDYFERLCTDYLDGNKISYNKAYVHNAAEEAAGIFSETVGLHNMGTASDRTAGLKSITSASTVVSALVIALMTGVMYILYSDKKKAQVYIFSGITGGAAGAAAGAMLCWIKSPLNALSLEPEIYKTALINAYNRYFMYLAAASAAVALAFWVIMFLTYRRQKKKD